MNKAKLFKQRPALRKSLTLLELIIAIVLFSTIILGFFTLDLFSRRQIASSQRLAKLQNELSYTLEHMTKNISQAVGRADLAVNSANNSQIIVWVDSNENGRRETAIDHYIKYLYMPGPDYQIRYYYNATDDPGSYETIAKKISGFQSSRTSNYINVKLTACWNPASDSTCGSSSNPSATMQTHIKMHAVTP